jgi:osmotically-inducible protein OsmY
MRTIFVRTLVVALLTFATAVSSAAGQGQDDLSARAQAAMRKTPSLSIFDDVSVAARDGIVTVRGCVTTTQKRDEVASAIAKLPGGREVANDLHVLPASEPDARLRVRLAQAIYGNPAFRRYAAMAEPPIHIIDNRGHVTLVGSVASDAERTLAFALAHLVDVAGLTNLLRVR